VLLAPTVLAHELRLAYLQLKESDADTYQTLWKVPARGEGLRLPLSVELPGHCRDVSTRRGSVEAGAYSERWVLHCDGGLAAARIRIHGLAEASADALVRIEYRSGASELRRLTEDVSELVVAGSPGAHDVAATYLVLGVEHILLGVDHLLFVLALLLIVSGARRLVATVTAFTIAHSITLAAATLGLVRVPIAPVEAAIALSIVFVAVEILRVQQGRPSLTSDAPWMVAFVFGLLHGFGFASALSEVGLPGAHIPMALLFFNLGVELGQLLFVAAILSLRAILRRLTRPPVWALRGPPYLIGSMAMFWVIQRVVAF
jgi:hydrogenase/urease accessory protein HupE